MKIVNGYFSVLLLFFTILISCNKEEKDQKIVQKIEPGSAYDYYTRGLESRDFEEKLHLYNEGLKLTKGIEDTTRILLLDGKIYAYSKLYRGDEIAPWIDSLIEAAKFHKDTFFIAKGYYRKGTMKADLNELDEAYENLFIARQYNLKAGDTSLAARRSFDMATTQFEMGDYSGTQHSATEAIKYLNPDRDSIFIGAAYNLIGLAYMDQGFYEEAVKEFNNALQFASRTRDSLTFLHNIAIVKKNQGKYDEALEILTDAVHSKAPDSISKSRYIDNLAFTIWTKDSSAQIDTLLFKSLEMRKILDDQYGLHSSYDHLSEYFENKDKSKSIDYARESLKSAIAAKADRAEVNALKKLISLVEPDEKAIYIDRYIYLHDSLDKASAKAKFYFAKVKYDEEKKEEEIFNLKVKNFNHSLEAERLRNRNLIYVLSILLILLGAGFLFYTYRQKSKRERLKEIYLTESRMSKRIHDELANDVYNLMSVFEARGDSETSSKLDEIYRRTRNISRENSQIETGENYIHALISNLSANAGNAKLILRGENSIPWNKVIEEKKIVIYRVLQELLVNMKKHSHATFVAVSFTLQERDLEIKYSDNGNGMDQKLTQYGNGFLNIENRLKKVDGTIAYETSPEKGFKAVIHLKI